MTNEIKNVPELRFPGFNGEWELLNLSKVLKDKSDGIKRGPFGGALKKEIFVSDGYAVYEQQNAIYDTQKFRYFITEQKFQEMKGFSIKENDIIMSCSGTIGKLSLIPSVYKKGIINQALIRFRTNNNILADYFLIYMRSNYMQRKILESNPGSAIVNLIPVKELKNLPFPLPNIKEQQKISAFFSKLDRQIELEEQKLAKLEEQKKGYMQKIFSQELRFKDENGNDYPNWIFEELNNIFTKYQNTIYLHDNEEYKRISISNKGKITHRDITFGKRIGRKRQYLIDLKKHPNTLTFIRQGVFLGGIGFIPSSLDGYIVTENMPLLSMSEEYSKKFMTYLFSSESYYKSVIFKNLPTGSAQKALHEKDWLKSFVNIPVYSEQEKIGNFFEKQDNLIKKQSDKVELLKERKKGFLQKMFV